MEVKEITTKGQLKELYDCSAMTWEGLAVDEDNVKAVLENCCSEGLDGTVYVTKGSTMNKLCKLTERNAYPENLNIVSVKKFKGLAINWGARWMDDIIDNNARREKLTASEIFR